MTPTDPKVTSARLKRRYRAEKRFRLYGIIAIAIALGFLALLLVSIFTKGMTAFVQTRIQVTVSLDAETLGLNPQDHSLDALRTADYTKAVRNGLAQLFPDVSGRSERRDLNRMLSNGVDNEIRQMVMDNSKLIGTKQTLWVLAASDVDMAYKGHSSRVPGQDGNRLNDRQLGFMQTLEDQGRLSYKFNTGLFTNGDSREPEQAGLKGALVGTFFSLSITLLLCFPLGVATAVYLEEFAPKNRMTRLIEVNINNLAAVPSVVFGLLGLAIFLNFFGMPRSAPLVGGLVLALISLPTIIIASRAALKAVPPSIREAAYGMGASRQQVVKDHVLPLALPGMMTGTILGMAHALGETAPLLMIGMIAFIVDIPQTPLDPSAVLPVQVFLWADSPERAFVERTSAAIIVLLGFLAVMNLAAIWLRKKFERRW